MSEFKKSARINTTRVQQIEEEKRQGQSDRERVKQIEQEKEKTKDK